MHGRARVAKQQESRTHTVEGCAMYKEERDVSEEAMRDRDESGKEKFGPLLNRLKRGNDLYPRRQTVATGGETGRG